MTKIKELKTNKTLLRVILAGAALLLLCGVLSGAAAAAGSWSDDVFTPDTSGYTSVNAFATDINTTGHDNTVSVNGSTVKLLTNVKLGDTLKIGGTVADSFILDLGGHVLSRNSTSGDFSVITVDSDHKFLTLTDSVQSTEHWFEYAAPNAKWTLYDGTPTESATVKVYDSLDEFDRAKADAFLNEGPGINLIYIKVTGGCITGGSAEYEGGGVYVAKNVTFTMEGGSIAGNSARFSGGGVYVATNGTFTMSGGSITGNTAKEYYGGGVCVNTNGTFTMSGGSITGNTAKDYYGGGVCVNTNGTFTMSGGSISGNSAAQSGGGVYVNEYGTFMVCGSPVIKNNTKTNGPVNNVYLYDSLITVIESLTHSTDGTNAYIGIASSLMPQEDFAMGVDAADNLQAYTVTAKDASCFHPDSGSLLPIVTTSASAAGSDSRLGLGGAAQIGSTSYLTVQDAINAAHSGDTITMIHDSTERTVAVGKKVTLDLAGHVLKNQGGGSVIKVVSGGNLTLRDSAPATPRTFTFVNDGPWTLDTSPAAGAVSLAEFDHAAAVGTYHVSVSGGVITGGNGSGVYIERGTFKMSGGSIAGNSAGNNGGGVYANGGSTFTISGGSIAGNSAGNNGGGVYANGGSTFTISGGSIARNSATSGGGVYVTGVFTMSGGSITGNSATGTLGNGGGVYSERGAFTMSGGSIAGNSATGTLGMGGGVYVDSGAFTMSGNASITGNSAYNGGGVYANSEVSIDSIDQASRVISTFWMNGGSIAGNTANNDGGGVYIYRGTFTMEGGSIAGNGAGEGGGVYVYYGGMFTMSGGSITGNSAGFGGGVEVFDSTFWMNGGRIAGNSADYGGGVYVETGGTFLIFGGSITGNSAEYGGGVYVLGGTFTMAGTASIVGNTPDDVFPKILSVGSTGGFTSETPVVKETPAKESSKSQGTSVWASATLTPTPTPSVTPTPAPKPEVPTVKPTTRQPTQTAKSPMAIAGVLAGLGAAAAVFGLRRK